jgi:hypothetical protein
LFKLNLTLLLDYVSSVTDEALVAAFRSSVTIDVSTTYSMLTVYLIFVTVGTTKGAEPSLASFS